MAASLVTTTLHAFADGSTGHVCALGSAPGVGNYDFLCVNSDTVVSTPTGFTVSTSRVNAIGSYLFYRKASGGESSSVTVVTSGNFNCQVSHSRWSGLDVVDTQASSTVIGTPSNTSVALTSPTLGGTGRFVLAFSAGGGIGLANQSAPVWSSGYTAVTGPNPQASGSSGMTGFVGYKTGAGTAAESPSVTWSGDACTNRDTHLVALTETTASGNDVVLAGVLGQITSALTATNGNRAALAGTLGQLTATLTTAQSNRATLAGVLGQITSTLTASGPFIPSTPGRAGAGSKPVARAVAGVAPVATARKGTVGT